jgi:alkaline phosphatase D
MSLHLSRRSYIIGSASALLALGTERMFGAAGIPLAQPAFSDYPFKLGVASGDPDSTGFVLWTRLAPKPLEGGGMGIEPVKVFWQVSEDEAMTKIVAKGETVAAPGLGHSVHVEVGGLKPDRWYWYQFKAGNEISPKGRTRTLENRDRPAAETSPLKMTFASCQHFEMGYYTAYDHMLAESPDIVFHLGDYIYEGPGRAGLVRSHVGQETMTLDDYRNRHAQYKTDASLQAMHAAAPWVVTWDDHEFDNNYAGDIPEEKSPADRLEFLKRRAAAYQAYYEHMPLRATSIPDGPGMRLYRSIRHGKLVDFHFLDTRQYRSDQPNGDGSKPQGPAALDPKASILGEAQRNWLLDELTNSRPVWNVLAQQVMMARVDRERGTDEKYSMDQWPGYEHERRAVLNAFDERKITNPVVLTGDIHTHWANDLIMDFDGKDSRVIGSEFVCSSITSKGDGKNTPKEEKMLKEENPFVHYFSDHRGYVSCKLDAKQWNSDFRVVEYVTRPGAPLLTPASFVLENNRPGLQKA